MHASNVANVEELHALILQQLKILGVSLPRSRSMPKIEPKKNGPSHRPTGTKHSKPLQKKPGKVFQLPLPGLHNLPTKAVVLKCEATVEVASFIVEACDCILRNVNTEGLFRRGGSSGRQNDIMAHLDAGKKLQNNFNEVDVAGVLKRFLRELPEPLVPSPDQEAFLRSMLLKEKKIDGLLYSCLLLPVAHINTLAYFMGFLSDIASHCNANMMNAKNLAIILTPAIMPLDPSLLTISSRTRQDMHIEVIELLIGSADKIGLIPESLCNSLSAANLILHMSTEEREKDDADCSSQSRQKKSRRSGSLTRMINGIKKMVGKGGPEANDTGNAISTSLKAVSTPCIKSTTKRKALQQMSMFSSKKKRDVLRGLPQMTTLANTPIAPSHLADTPGVYTLTPTVCKHPNPRKSTSPTKTKQRKFFGHTSDKIGAIVEGVELKSGLSLRNRRSLKKQKPSGELALEDHSGVGEISEHPPMMERRWSTSFFGRRKRVSGMQSFPLPVETVTRQDHDMETVSCDVFSEQADLNLSLVGVNLSPQSAAADSSEDFIRIPKREFEDFKKRVSAMELKIEEFDSLVSPSVRDEDLNEASGTSSDQVQSKYRETLVQATAFDGSSTDQLAKRFGRELKIRRSLENRVIRSPSARRIGSLRRRSRDSGRSSGKIKSSTLGRNLSWHLSSNSSPSHVPAVEFCPGSSLKRGRPNTVFMGLPQPTSMAASISLEENVRIHLVFEHENASKSSKSDKTVVENVPGFAGLAVPNVTPLQISHYPIFASLDTSGPLTRSQAQRSVSFSGTNQMDSPRAGDVSNGMKKSSSHGYIISPTYASKEEWVDAQHFFKSKQDYLAKIPPTGRDSIAKIRSQNAGMVLQRMKLFDSNKASPARNVQRRSFDRCKTSTPLRLGRTQSVLATDSASKLRARHFERDATKNPPRLRQEQFDQAGAAAGGTKRSCQPTLRGSPKKIGTPRKHLLAKNSTVIAQKQKLKMIQSNDKGSVCTSQYDSANLKQSQSVRAPPSMIPIGRSTNSSPLPAKCSGDRKENIASPVAKNTFSHSTQLASKVSFSPQISLPDHLKETIYDVCTPVVDKLLMTALPRVASISPLKDCNRARSKTPRATPFIKQPLVPLTPRHVAKTPAKDHNARRLLTPMRALGNDACNTPIGSPRRQSPRLLLMKSRALAKT